MQNNRRGRGGRIAPGMRPVDETTRIDIGKIISDFQAGNDEEYRFPPNLTNHERAIVHNECKKYGFASKSSGKGSDRAVCIFKRQRKSGKSASFEFQMKEETLLRVEKYFRGFPPSDTEINAIIEETKTSPEEGNVLSKLYMAEEDEVAGHLSAKAAKSKSKTKRALDLSPLEIEKKRSAWERNMESKSMEKLVAARNKLPIAQHRDAILQAISSHQVVLIAGETGCGKTTQVPQYILEECWSTNQPCRILCTQPRRISATSVAERIASERAEKLGINVGYTIRLDKKGSDECSIMFCTNGIMLRMLTSPEEDIFGSLSHVVIDEIHERDRFADFMLIIIRDLLGKYPKLRIILMSATLHEDLFSSYFGSCPVIRVPGFTYPVKDFYLEDILKLTGYQAAVLRQMKNEIGDCNITSNLKGPSVGPEKQIEIQNAIEHAFKRGNEQDFLHLVDVTGAVESEEASTEVAPGINVQHGETGATPLIAACFHGLGDVIGTLLANGADPRVKATNGMDAIDCARLFGHNDLADLLETHCAQSTGIDDVANAALAVSYYQSHTDSDEVDLGLIEELLLCICDEQQNDSLIKNTLHESLLAVNPEANAILIFLPGWDEIIRLKEKLEASSIFGNQYSYLILPLHSMVAPAEQTKVFIRPDVSVRKIILSTNVAETAITIDDVAFVIDSGKHKEKSYDPYTGISTLQSGWISQASAKQRRGRAGRCQPGIAFHLYTRHRSESLEEYQLPEIMRTPLEEMGLQVKLLETPGNRIKIADFLSKAVEPPVLQAVNAAIKLLEAIGALEEGSEKLTVLGRHLASLPISPTLGKMLLYGVIYDCLDPILTVSCCLGYRDPWVLPANPESKRQAFKIKKNFSSQGSGFSDHLATVMAFNEWASAKQRGKEWNFCYRNFLNNATMMMIDGMRYQLLGELIGKGFIKSLDESSSKASRADVVRSVMACGFYPNVARIAGNPRNDRKSKSAIITPTGERVRIHPNSVNADSRNDTEQGDDLGKPNLLFYDELTRGDAVTYIKSCTEVQPHPIFLVASHLSMELQHPRGEETDTPDGKDLEKSVNGMQLDDSVDISTIKGSTFWEDIERRKKLKAIVTIDGWLKYRMSFQEAVMLSLLRLRVSSAFAAKATHPRRDSPKHLALAVNLTSNMFLKDGNPFSNLAISTSRQKSNSQHPVYHHRKPAPSQRNYPDSRSKKHGIKRHASGSKGSFGAHQNKKTEK